jgi:hypothetical protein
MAAKDCLRRGLSGASPWLLRSWAAGSISARLAKNLLAFGLAEVPSKFCGETIGTYRTNMGEPKFMLQVAAPATGVTRGQPKAVHGCVAGPSSPVERAQ